MGSENVGALGVGPSVRFSVKMSVLVSVQFSKVLFDVWKVGCGLSESGVCNQEAELE